MAIGLMGACAKYFGKKEGQSVGDFGKEIKEIAPADRVWFAAELTKVLGTEVSPDLAVSAGAPAPG
jgi:hypothetical protein